MFWQLPNKQFLHATAVLVGTMVGVGIFGIPFVFAKAGFVVGTVFLLFAAGVTLLSNLFFAEVILRTHAPHQLVGYAGRYLGPGYKRLMLMTNTLGIYGALLAYIVVVGEFFHNIFSASFFIHPSIYSIIFAVIMAVVLLVRFRTVASIEFFLTGLFFVVIAVIVLVGVPKVDVSNYLGVTWEFWFLPYGVLLFAFGGLTSIPIQRQILVGQEHKLRSAIILAVSIGAIFFFVFAAVVVGISGDVTSPDALSGLFEVLGFKIILLGSVFGIAAISTSYLMLGTALKEIFQLDYQLSKQWSWFLVVLPPFLLFAAGLRTFIDIIGLVGAVAIGIETVVLILLYVRARQSGDRIPEMTVNVHRIVLYLLVGIFLLGVVYALFVQ